MRASLCFPSEDGSSRGRRGGRTDPWNQSYTQETSTLGPPLLTFMDGTLLKVGFGVWLVQNSAAISFSEKFSWTWLTVLVLLL